MKQSLLYIFLLMVLPMAAQSEDKDSLSVLDTLNLSEVTVVAQRPLVQQKADRVAYDVKGDEDSKTSTLIEMLKKVPFVTVDAQNNISVKGSTNFKIYKNGRPNKSFSGNAKDIFQALPASAVKRIEVITEPGAKYDGEGLDGILNIVMDDELKLVGAMGNVRFGAGTSGNIGGGLWGMFQAGKLVMTAEYFAQSQGKGMTESQEIEERFYKQSGNRYFETNKQSNPGWSSGGGIEGSYEIDSLNLITGSLNMWNYDVDINHAGSVLMTDADGNTLYSYDKQTRKNTKQSYIDIDGHLDYQHLTRRKGESLNVSYLFSGTRTNYRWIQDFTNIVNAPGYTRWDVYRKNNFSEHTLQVDYVRPLFKGHELEIGAKYILRRNDSDSGQEFDNGMEDLSDLLHTTQVAAMYGQYKMQVQKWTFIGGLRYEYSYLKAKFRDGSADNFHRSLNDWIPSATISRRLTDSQTLRLNYAMRINRPGISYLNPVLITSLSDVTFGNPRLESSNQHNLTLSHSLTGVKLTVNNSVTASLSNNLLTTYKYMDGGVVYSTYDNIGRFRRVTLETYIQWKPFSTTTWMYNGSLGWKSLENKNQDIKNSRYIFSFYTQLQQKLPWKLNLSLGGGCYESAINGFYSHSNSLMYYNFSLQRQFLKDDRMTVRLMGYNPIAAKWYKRKTWVTHGDYTGKDVSMYNSRFYGVTLTYKIGSLNANVKKTQKTINNDDLQGRK